jgi:hypothetical protein
MNPRILPFFQQPLILSFMSPNMTYRWRRNKEQINKYGAVKRFLYCMLISLTLSNPIFLTPAYSPALILGGKEVGGLLVIILQF